MVIDRTVDPLSFIDRAPDLQAIGNKFVSWIGHTFPQFTVIMLPNLNNHSG